MLRNVLKPLSFTVLALLFAGFSAAQDAASVLKPPKGSKMAIVVFEDLQCPECARAHPVIEEAGRKYKIPVMVHDFPLPMHNWSYKAAVYARYFDTQSKQLGDDFRTFIFQHQPEINPQNLQQFLDQFAREHKTDLPFAVDPQGKLAAAIQADKDLGTRVGLNHTPTIYVVTNKASGAPYEEVTDRTQLFSTIDRMKVE
jgi:protein-disulfide isomerase